MKQTFRVLVLLVVVPSTYYFIFWVPFSLIPVPPGLRWINSTVALLCAIAVGWYVWSKTGLAPDKLISSVLYGAIVLGGVGFFAGFLGPIIFTPDANQGPLLGIFITGPLGFLLGGIGGFFYWLIRGRKTGTNSSPPQDPETRI